MKKWPYIVPGCVWALATADKLIHPTVVVPGLGIRNVPDWPSILGSALIWTVVAVALSFVVETVERRRLRPKAMSHETLPAPQVPVNLARFFRLMMLLALIVAAIAGAAILASYLAS